MSSPLVAPPVAKTKALYCPNCGGPIELRGFGHALTAVCPQCLSVLDASTPELSILQKIQEKQRSNPLIPLGSRGKFGDTAWETIGYQTRTVIEDGESFTWEEYLLFNPYKGFRYLTQYDGHWNFVTPLGPQPARLSLGSRPAVSYEGRTFKHFSGAEAQTSFVLGEFPWRVKVGEKVIADDFIDPPTVLSSETTPHEVTWSRGDYMQGADVWKAFALPGSAPPAKGVYLNQPNPRPQHSGAWKYFFLFLLGLVVLFIYAVGINPEKVVFQDHYRYSTANTGEQSFVTPIFELTGRTAALELDVNANISDNWAYFNFALINQDTGQGFDFGREVSYYSGSDSDGSWSEGGTKSEVFIPSVPPGHYYLRVEPEMDADSGIYKVAGKKTNAMEYSLVLKHEVPNLSWFWIAALLLLIPPMFLGIRGRTFETKRWMTSDYPPITTNSSSSD